MNPNQVVTTTGFGSRIMSAIIGVPVGLLLIFGSCIMLYLNEGRTDYSKIAKKSIPVQASQVDQSQNGKFVSVTGSVTGQQLGDGNYLKPISAIAVQRVVEEYAWVETQQTQSHNNVGGSQTNTTTYTYKEVWVDQVPPSGSFHEEQGHENPKKPLGDTLVRTTSGQVGAYSFDPQTIKLPSLQDVTLSSENTALPVATPPIAMPPSTPTTQGTSTTAPTTTNALANINLASSQYLYGGTGNLSSPQLGDVRVSYKDLPSGTNVTVFGQLNNGKVAAYTDSNNHTLYDLLAGDRQTAIATLHSQYEKITWILRGVGLGLIWIGLMMLLAPLDTLLDFIPFVGEIGGMLSLVITFPIALVLGGTVIIIGYTLHHLIALLIGVPLIFVIWVGIFKLIKKARNIPKRGGGGSGSPPPAMPQQPTNPYTPASPTGGGSLFPPNNPAMPVQNVGAAIPPPPQSAQPNQYPSVNPGTVAPQVSSPSSEPQNTPMPPDSNQQPPPVVG